MQVRYPAARILVYTGDTDAAPDMILAKARDRFNMQIANTRYQPGVCITLQEKVSCSKH